MSETTVRDIEWWVNPEFTPWVSAEDEKLFPAGIYAQQVVDEHNGFQEMKRALVALVDIQPEEMSDPTGELEDWFACCGAPVRYEEHKLDCPWLVAKQLLGEQHGRS